jgi:hypothetical protein
LAEFVVFFFWLDLVGFWLHFARLCLILIKFSWI